MLTSRKEAKKNLAILWFIVSGLLFAVLLAQTVLDVYDPPEKPWKWFFPTVLPTLSLIVGVLVADAQGQAVDVQMVDRFIFRLAFGLSLLYLITVGVSVFGGPIRAAPDELMDMSSLWLGPFQGVVAGIIGAFFVNKGGQR